MRSELVKALGHERWPKLLLCSNSLFDVGPLAFSCSRKSLKTVRRGSVVIRALTHPHLS
jgi:hypothetical protein